MSPSPRASSADQYARAREIYAGYGVDTELALQQLGKIPLSLHCWQGDDVRGFEPPRAAHEATGTLGGGLAVTGSYPGRARNADELRADLQQALSFIPGRHRVNLHAIYGDYPGRYVERNALTVDLFTRWIDWAQEHQLGLDFNPTFFSHPLADTGFTLAHADAAIRQFWIEHGIACREIARAFGERLGTPAVINFWIPDGYKDLPVDRRAPRARLTASLDQIFAKSLDASCVLDAVEAKLFGIGSESYVVGSHEFYLSYAITRQKLLCLDAGHFHPTESIADKISAVLPHVPGLLLHLSRGVRWDSDHVVIGSDDLKAIAQELVRAAAFDQIHVGLDFFDASIHRVAAWVLGARNVLRALLQALLEPLDLLRQAESDSNYTRRLALLEMSPGLPWQAVWDRYCEIHSCPPDSAWLADVEDYERRVTSRRS